jgi:hypothetical protein
MRKLLISLLVTLGIAALVRRLRRHRAHEDREPAAAVGPEAAVEPSAGEGSADDPADELRRKLANTRAEGTVVSTPSPADADSTVEDRRAEVHEQGRSTLDEMRESSES